jgi:serine/threonine protein kinase
MDLGAWATISRLLDEALDLPAADRAAWLERLDPEHAALKPRLRAMLERASTDNDDFLAGLPTLSSLGSDPGSLRLNAGEAGEQVGPYRLIRELASGGQGAVWLAERADGLLDRPVALKLPIGLAFRPHLTERMARERQILASLTHPHIARLYDAGFAEGGTPYLAMEYVDGTSLDCHAAARDLDVAARVALFVPVIRAVAFAHGRLVIHRDLKPSNIMVTPEGDVRLLDFGIARLLDEARPFDSTLTEVGGRAMTLRYASPEQVAHHPLGVATDVYSLGVVLYELVTGQSPYRPARDTVAALEEAVLAADPVRPSEAAGDPAARRALRGDLDTILLKALKKDPAERYATASDFADDLTRWLQGRPVDAQPDTRR